MGKDELIITREEYCVGCNACIRSCHVMEANTAYLSEDGNNKVKINADKCIHCGKCISVCKHGAREYRDDIDEFISDLKGGRSISILVTPAIRGSIKEYKKVLGFLKSLGVKTILDVSIGADITTWAYLRYIEKNKVKTCISQPCPAIVNYIKKYKSELLPNLIPVQSPIMCAAIYYRDYLGVNDDMPLLSPCIAKKDEINASENKGYIKYNVTIGKLMEYINDKKINLSEYKEAEIKDKGVLGFLYSRPGGLKENVAAIHPELWVRQIEGQGIVYKYFDEYGDRIKQGKSLPLLIDALNCEFGCNVGTALLNNNSQVDDIDQKFNNEKNKKGKKEIIKIHKEYDKKLKLDSFIRSYVNISNNELKIVNESEKEQVFASLKKITEKDKKLNCSACGYNSCEEMVTAIFNGLNLKENCIDYNRKTLKEDKEKEEAEKNEIEVALDKIEILSKLVLM